MVRRHLAPSRTSAQRLITDRMVTVSGAVSLRASMPVSDETRITVDPGMPRWVSRGAVKLLAALEAFPVDPGGRIALDVGASTGGFTQVLLKAGARRVVALDVGHGQLDPGLADDPRVTSVEHLNIRDADVEELGGPFDLVVADLSFISLCVVARDLRTMATDGADLIVLVKPEFEVGRSGLDRRGVVRDPESRRRCVRKVMKCLDSRGLGARGVIRSPVEGGDGNIEYLLWLGAGMRRLEVEVPG